MAGASGTKDSDQIDWKFPWWDGEWTSYSDYVFRVELKADATKEDELPHLGPKLAGNLVGRAFEAIADVDRVELRGKDGWKYLLRHLEQKRGKEKVDVLGDAFAEFFIKRDTYRREGEELGDFELRFRTMVRRLDKAIRDSGSEGRMPQEVYGWSLLHMYARMDPSDIANVRGRADSYRLEHVLSALHRMWSGGGLVMKDAEKKKKASGKTLLVDEEESPERSDTQHGVYYDEDEEDMQQELDEAAAWFHEISVAFNDSPEDPEIYASYQEARKALDKARVSRGFYPVRNPNQKGGRIYNGLSGKGSGKNYNKSGKGFSEDYSDKICLRCGKKGHIARICPQKPAGFPGGKGGNSGKIGFVGTVFTVHEAKDDYWTVDEERKMLHRHHVCQRKKLFAPDLHACPVPLSSLTGQRITKMDLVGLGGAEMTDCWHVEGSRSMTSTTLWTGTTSFALVPEKEIKKVQFDDGEPSLIAAADETQNEPNEEIKSEVQHAEDAIYVQTGENPMRGKAIIDSGASDNIVGVETLQDLASVYEEMGFNPQEEIEVDRSMHKNFVFGNNQSSAALGLSHVNAGLCGSEITLQAHMVEGGTPFLLSSKFLYDMKATINFRTGVGVFEAVSDQHVKLERSPGNHLMLPVTAFAGHSSVLNAMRVDHPDAGVQKIQCTQEMTAGESQGTGASDFE